MQINPTLAIWLNIAEAALTALTIPTLNALGFTAKAPIILAWGGLINVVLNAVLHAYSSSIPGPLAPPDPPAVVRATEAAKEEFLMRKFAPVLFAGTLAACTAAQVQTISQDFFNSVSAGTVAACSYLPDFDAVANVFAALSYVGTIKTIVDDICAGAKPNAAKLRAAGADMNALTPAQSSFKIIVKDHSVFITGHYVNH